MPPGTLAWPETVFFFSRNFDTNSLHTLFVTESCFTFGPPKHDRKWSRPFNLKMDVPARCFEVNTKTQLFSWHLKKLFNTVMPYTFLRRPTRYTGVRHLKLHYATLHCNMLSQAALNSPMLPFFLRSPKFWKNRIFLRNACPKTVSGASAFSGFGFIQIYKESQKWAPPGGLKNGPPDLAIFFKIFANFC